MKVPALSGDKFLGIRSGCCGAKVYARYINEDIDWSKWDAAVDEPTEEVCSSCRSVNPKITFSEELRQKDFDAIEDDIVRAERKEWHRTLDRNPQRL